MREGKRKGLGGGCKHLFPLRSFVKQHNSIKNPATAGEPRWLVACELPYLVIKVTCCQTVCAGVSRQYSGGGESLRSPCRSSEGFNPRRTQQDHRREAAERKTPNMWQWREEAGKQQTASSASGGSRQKMFHSSLRHLLSFCYSCSRCVELGASVKCCRVHEGERSKVFLVKSLKRWSLAILLGTVC